MARAIRRSNILVALAACAFLLNPALPAAPAARPQPGTPESILFDAANRDRAANGLPPFQWDSALAASAQLHAQRMAQRRTLSHQFPGEPPLQQRAMQTGARFSVIAENVAEGPSAGGLHNQWMNSAPHRANLLANDMNAVGIAVVQNGNMFFGVEDFSEAVGSLSLNEQEKQVADQLSSLGMRSVTISSDARKTCNQDRGGSGQKPMAVLRYETTDLSQLPDDIAQKIQSGRYHSASVGACEAGGSSGFTRFRIAVLLFP